MHDNYCPPLAAPPECGCLDYTPRTQFRVPLLSLNVLLVLNLKALPSPSAGQPFDVSIQSVNPYWQSRFFQQTHLNYPGRMTIPYSSSMLSFKLLFINVLPVPLLGKGDDMQVTSGRFNHFLVLFSAQILLFSHSSSSCAYVGSELRALPYSHQLNVNSATTQD